MEEVALQNEGKIRFKYRFEFYSLLACPYLRIISAVKLTVSPLTTFQWCLVFLEQFSVF